MAVLCSEELGEAYVTPFQKFNSNSGDFEYFYTTVSKDYSPIQTCGIVLNKMLAKNGGRNTDAMPDQSFLYDQSQNLSDNLFIRPGYTFKNWDDLAKGGGNSYTDKQNVKNLVSEANGTVTLYAQWTANEQNVNFDANGGSTDQKTITGKTDETVDLSEVKPASRAGYSFKGWYTSKTGDTKMPANVKLADGGVTYYAQWTANGKNKNNSNTQSGQAKHINGSKPNLPSTGEQRENIFYILGGVIVFLAIVLYVVSKKNRRNK